MLDLEKITHTTEGYEIRNLKYKPLDNIIVGQVKDPIAGKPNLFDGWIMVTWRLDGCITWRSEERFGKRDDLKLKI